MEAPVCYKVSYTLKGLIRIIHLEKLHVFRSVPIWRQQASEREDGLVVWDYHVVAIAQTNEGSSFSVFDLDS